MNVEERLKFQAKKYPHIYGDPKLKEKPLFQTCRLYLEETGKLEQHEIFKICGKLQVHQNQELKEEKAKVLKSFKDVDKERWDDARHCSCLGHAIWKLDNSYKGGSQKEPDCKDNE